MLALGVQVAEVGAKGKAAVNTGDAPICSAVRAIFTGAIRAITRDIFFIALFHDVRASNSSFVNISIFLS